MRPIRLGAARNLPGCLAALACLAAGCEEPPPRPRVHVERLTSRQIANTMTDLTGYVSPSWSALPGAEPGTPLTVSVVDADVLRAGADEAAAAMTADLEKWAPCAASEPPRSCASRVIERFGLLAYRTPVPPDARDDMLGLFELVHAEQGYPRAVEALLSALLQSPRTLYRVETEVEGADGKRRVDDFAIASRLSYFVWDSAPDRQLLQAAARGDLRQPEVRAREAERMFRDARATRAFVARVRDWLGVDFSDVTKDPAAFPSFDPAAVASMSAEVDSFVERAGWGDDGSFHRLASEPFDAGDPHRRGVLMLPGVLTALATSTSSSPVLRGKLVRERLFCESIAAPPAGLVIMAPGPSSGMTTRERYEAHAAEEPCATCHEKLDPLGFAFEHYDAVGQRRETENGAPIDASGTAAHAATRVSFNFDEADELLLQLDESGVAARCWARYFAELAFGQRPDAEVMAAIEAEVLARGTSTQALWLAVVRSPAFIEPIRDEGGAR